MNHSMQVMSSSNDMTWETPRYFFDFLDRKYRFQLDPCCVPATAKCERFYTPADDGLAQDWNGLRVFMNPPYGRELPKWIEKAYRESLRGALVVCLVPARTDTRWFQDWAMLGEVTFLRGRLKNPDGTAWPFPAVLIEFKQQARPGALQLLKLPA